MYYEEPLPAIPTMVLLVMISAIFVLSFMRFRTEKQRRSLSKMAIIPGILILVLIILPLGVRLNEELGSACPYCREEAVNSFLIPVSATWFLFVLFLFIFGMISRKKESVEDKNVEIEDDEGVENDRTIPLILVLTSSIILLQSIIIGFRAMRFGILYWYVWDEYMVYFLTGFVFSLIFIIGLLRLLKKENSGKVRNKAGIINRIRRSSRTGLTKMSMILLALTLIGSATAYYFVRNDLRTYYEKDIRIETMDPQGDMALKTAEGLDYQVLFNLTEFDGWLGGDPHVGYDSYVWTGIISSTTLQFYSNKIDHLKENKVMTHAYMHYHANVTFMEEVSISIADGGLLIENGSKGTIAVDRYMWSPVYAFYFDDHVVIRKASGVGYFSELPIPEISMNCSDVYFVWMHFSYSEYYASLAAFGMTIDQYVVLDGNMNVRFILINDHGQWIS